MSFAAFLPIAELGVWSAAVLVPSLLTYARLIVAAKGDSGHFGITLPHNVLLFSLTLVCEQRFLFITCLNLPGMLIGAPVTIPVIAHLRDQPVVFSTVISPQTWNTLTSPFFCIPAWWFVGKNLDTLAARRRVSKVILAIGSILCCACVAFSIGTLSAPPTDINDLIGFLPGSIFWTIAFATVPLGWLLMKNKLRR
jgi:hypothetical protein